MKGLFTQSFVVLLSEPISVDEIEDLLGDYEIPRRTEAAESWELSGPGLIVAWRPEVNGHVQVDLVDQPWPDHMGDPASEGMLFGAWSMGHFGPFAFPGGLQRAIEQSWSCQEASDVAPGHRAFLRLRMSYIFGASDDTPVMPADCDPLSELHFLTELTLALLEHPSALCYYNPNGELLQTGETMAQLLGADAENGLPPLDVWSNIRLFNLPEDWSAMDSVGMWQLDAPDHEAGFLSERYEPDEVACFLRDLELYMLHSGEVIADGDSVDGPGDVIWRVRTSDDGLTDPPRNTLRWLPEDRSVPPSIFYEESAQAKNAAQGEETATRKPWWKAW